MEGSTATRGTSGISRTSPFTSSVIPYGGCAMWSASCPIVIDLTCGLPRELFLRHSLDERAAFDPDSSPVMNWMLEKAA